MGCRNGGPRDKGRDGAAVGQHVFQHTLPNGMVLLAEHMEHVRSVALSFLVPAGSAFDPNGAIRPRLAPFGTDDPRGRQPG